MGSAARRRLLWSPLAQQDLREAWSYLAEEASPDVADAQLREIERASEALRSWPDFGRARFDVRDGLRSVLAGRHVVFYRVAERAVEIVRVLNERRDVERIFPEEG